MTELNTHKCLNPLCENLVETNKKNKDMLGQLAYCSFECYSLFPPKMYQVTRKWESNVEPGNDFTMLKQVVNMVNEFDCPDVDKAEMLKISRVTFKKWVTRLNAPIDFRNKRYHI